MIKKYLKTNQINEDEGGLASPGNHPATPSVTRGGRIRTPDAAALGNAPRGGGCIVRPRID